MTWLRLVLAAWVLLAGSAPAHAANTEMGKIGGNFVVVTVVVLLLAGLVRRVPILNEQVRRARAGRMLRFVVGAPLIWLALAFVHAETGLPSSGWVAFPLWFALTGLFVMLGDLLVPGPLRRLWALLFPPRVLETHGSAHFGTAAIGARHLAPAAPADAFVLGILPDAPRNSDARFRQDGHILTCAPTGAGKGIGAVVPNLLTYPGSAFVLDFKGENYAVTARARRELGQHVMLVDPFGITGNAGHALNWLDTLDPDSPDVVSRAAGLADMLIVARMRTRIGTTPRASCCAACWSTSPPFPPIAARWRSCAASSPPPNAI